jgi:hypothetical protein
MNKFFVVLLAFEKETEKWSKKALYEYDTQDEAVKNFHQSLAAYINSPTYSQCSVVVLDSFGNSIRSEYWTEPVEEPEPEPEVTEPTETTEE